MTDILNDLLKTDIYLPFWNPDFLHDELGREGTCARFYPDKKLAIDIGNPNSKTNRTKKELLHQAGFHYVCVPLGSSPETLSNLFDAASKNGSK
jgi:hypothetical protein